MLLVYSAFTAQAQWQRMKTTQRLTSTNQLSQNRVIGMQSYPVYQSWYFLKRPQNLNYITNDVCTSKTQMKICRVDNVHYFRLRNYWIKKKWRQSFSYTASLKTWCACILNNKVKFDGIIFLFVLNLSFNRLVFCIQGWFFTVSKKSISVHALCPE